jgi:hypothetical protein
MYITVDIQNIMIVIKFKQKTPYNPKWDIKIKATIVEKIKRYPKYIKYGCVNML